MVARIDRLLRSRNRRFLCAAHNGRPIALLELAIEKRGCHGKSTVLYRVAPRLILHCHGPYALVQPMVLALVKDLYVLPEFRHRGIARGLLESSIPRLQGMHVRQIHAAVSATDKSRHVFQALGFTTSRLLLQKKVSDRRHSEWGDTGDAETWVRCATSRDVAQLAELVRLEVVYQASLAGCFDLHPNVDWIRYVDHQLRFGHTVFLVAERAGDVVGYVEARLIGSARRRRGVFGLLKRLRGQRSSKPRPVGFVEDIYVQPDARSNGCATALLERAINWLQERSAIEIQAAVWSGNEASLHLFRKQGFQPAGYFLARDLARHDTPAGSNTDSKVLDECGKQPSY